MSFKPYPKYKESGVEWLGRVPEHWTVMPIRLAARLESGHTPSRNHPEYWENCTIPWFTLADVWQIREGLTDVVTETKEKVSELGVANSAARVLPAGTVMLSRTASVGFSAIMGVDMATTQDFANWVCGPDVVPRFLLQAFRAMGSEFRRLMMGSTHNTIYMPDIASFRFVLPPPAEQSAVVSFIDHETAKIDALIAEQQRLIELLQEKRQAVISHAVTKGLNPDAPMKDSRIEWLGEVPEHWEVMPVWILFELGRGRVISHGEIADNLGPYPVYSSQTENDGVMGSINTYAYEGDFLTWTTDGANAGTVFRRQGLFNCTNVCGTLRARSDRIVLEYAHRAIQHATGYFVRHDINPKLMNNVMAAIRIPIPPLAEQTQIAHRVSAVAGRGDSLVTEMNKAISLLQERRSAIISAAVTGQIDVRSFSTGEGSEAA